YRDVLITDGVNLDSTGDGSALRNFTSSNPNLQQRLQAAVRRSHFLSEGAGFLFEQLLKKHPAQMQRLFPTQFRDNRRRRAQTLFETLTPDTFQRLNAGGWNALRPDEARSLRAFLELPYEYAVRTQYERLMEAGGESRRIALTRLSELHPGDNVDSLLYEV